MRLFNIIKVFIDKISYKKANRSWEGKRKYLIKKGAVIGEGTRLNCTTSSFGTEPYLIKVGKDCLLANGTHFYTHDGGIKVINHLVAEGVYPYCKKMEKFAPITIGNNVYVGSNAQILPGVTIGDNCIIGAGAIVTKDIPSNTVAVGIPAKTIMTIDEYYQNAIKKQQIYSFEGKSKKEKEEFLRSLLK